MEKTDVRKAGIEFVHSNLTKKGWFVKGVMRGRMELFQIAKGNQQHTIQIRTLSKEAPVPFPTGFDVLDGIDYLVICYDLQGQPKLAAMRPDDIR